MGGNPSSLSSLQRTRAQRPSTQNPPKYDAVLIRDQADLADPGEKAQTSGRYHTRSLLAGTDQGAINHRPRNSHDRS